MLIISLCSMASDMAMVGKEEWFSKVNRNVNCNVQTCFGFDMAMIGQQGKEGRGDGFSE